MVIQTKRYSQFRKRAAFRKKKIARAKPTAMAQKKQIFSLQKQVTRLNKAALNQYVPSYFFGRIGTSAIADGYNEWQIVDPSLMTEWHSNKTSDLTGSHAFLKFINVRGQITGGNEADAINRLGLYIVKPIESGFTRSEVDTSYGTSITNTDQKDYTTMVGTDGFVSWNPNRWKILHRKHYLLKAETPHVSSDLSVPSCVRTFNFNIKLNTRLFQPKTGASSQSWRDMISGDVPFRNKIYFVVFTDNASSDSQNPDIDFNLQYRTLIAR